MVCSSCSAECADGAVECTSCGAVLVKRAAVAGGAVAVGKSPMAAASASTLPAGSVDAIAGIRRTEVVVADRMLGQTLGSYRLLDILGEGGMGRVYLAEHVKIGRKVALKMLHSHLSSTPQVIRRFFAEARAVNKILHEHIVEITDFIENPGGDNYFIMEHLRGDVLADVLERETLSLGRSLGIAVQICSALGAVHDASIIHRDLKPDNVFLTTRGGQKDFVKLLDFGIAKLMDGTGEGISLQQTAAGVIMGTPEYMSPEQANAKPVDKRSDIYSFGVILYELCTGRKPFEADNFGELLMMHASEKPKPPSKLPDLFQKVPKPLEDLIMACLEKDPDDRPQSAQEVESALREVADSYAVQLEQFDVSRPFMERRGKLMSAGVLAAAVLIAVIVFAMGGQGEQPAVVDNTPPPPPAVVAAPEPAPEAAPIVVPTLATVKFKTRPKGAEVYQVGVAEPLGVTPFTTELAVSSDSVVFEFRKEGFEVESQEVELTGNTNLSVRLARVKKEVASTSKKSSKKSGKKTGKTSGKKTGSSFKEGAVMNPFD